MEANSFKKIGIGIAFALSACLIWGVIFVVPQFMPSFNAIEVSSGRYVLYGLLSSFLFLRLQFIKKRKYPFSIWKKAFLYSLIFAVGYYPCVVLGARFSSPAICALIMGIAPISIALYGNWKEKECTYKSLFFPSLLILIGLVLVNAPAFQSAIPSTYLIGLGSCIIALSAWSWYVVANARFLKRTPEMLSSEWATLNGICTFFWILLFLAATACFSSESIQIKKYIGLHPEAIAFLSGSAILGIVCSFIAFALWNRATLYLPVSLAGQLTVFETIFGLVYIYALEARMPPLFECIGIIFFLAAIVYGIRKASQITVRID